MKNVIVTGGTGFIGSWLIDYLLSQGVYVCAIVRNKSRLLRDFVSNPNFTYIEKDLDSVSVHDLIVREWDCFYHLAWDGVSSVQKNNSELQINNIITALNMMRLAKEVGCKKFIASGTVAEYVFSEGPMDFSKKQTPNDFYGAAKVSTHFFLDVESERIDMPYIWAVLPSTFGERREDNNIITYTIRSLLMKEIPQYGSLDQMWDFLYVGEVVRALFLLGQSGRTGKTYGIGSGDHRTLKEYITTVRDMIDPTLPLGIGANSFRTKQLMSSCVDIEELTNDTGFTPVITFEKGIEKTIEYFKRLL